MITDDSESDQDSYGSDDEEIAKYEEDAAEGIANGTLGVKNRDGTYTCPFSPGRKKQSYKYREILAHATGVGRGKKAPKKVGTHRALAKFLEAELGDGPMIPQAPRLHQLEQAIPKREAKATKLLCPWMGILVNIDNSKRREADGFRLAAGAADIKEKFKEFNPERVDVFHDIRGHQGTALLTFRNDIHGYEDAQAYEQSFALAHRGSKEWWGNTGAHSDQELYGWQATEEDLTADLGLLTVHLRKFCDLKTVKDMVEEKERMNKQVVEDLVKTVGQKNDILAVSREKFVVLRNMVVEVDALLQKTMEDKREMEEKHKQDLEEMRKKSQEDLAKHNEKLLSHQVALTNKMRMLERRCAEMKQTEQQMRQKNEAERQQFEREKQEAQRQLDEVSKQAELHAVMQCKQRDQQKEMIKKHEGENKALEMAVQAQKKKLVQKQQLELQRQHVKELLEIEKAREADKEAIANLESEQDLLQSMVNDLTVKERTSNDELEEARKVAIEVLRKYGTKDHLGIKLAGSINKEVWEAPCKEKYKYHTDGWEFEMARIISEWEGRFLDQNYRPMKMVEIGNDKWKREIVEDDLLKKLKEDLGIEVMTAVTTAFLEIEEHNASGRYSVELAWDFTKNQKVVLKDLLLFLKDLLDSGKKGKARKRVRG